MIARGATGLFMGVLVASLVVLTVLLTPARAWRVAKASVLHTTIDDLFEEQGAEVQARLTVRGVPISAGMGARGEGVLLHAGGTTTMRWEVIDVPRPGSQRRSSLGIRLDRPIGSVPGARIALETAALAELYDRALVLRMAAPLGVPAAWCALWPVALNGDGISLRLVREEVGEDYLRARTGEGPDLIALRTTDAINDPWSPAARWTGASGAQSPVADSLNALVVVLNDTTLGHYRQRDHVQDLLDVEAFIRMDVLLRLFDAHVPAPVLVWDEHAERCVPVLADVRAGYVESALVKLLRADTEWRHRHDRALAEGTRLMRAGDAFELEALRMDRALTDALRADRGKIGLPTEEDPGEYRIDLPRARAETRALREAHLQRWHALTNTVPHAPDRQP